MRVAWGVEAELRVLAGVLATILLVAPAGIAAGQSDGGGNRSTAAPAAVRASLDEAPQTGTAMAADWEYALTPFLWLAGMDGTVAIAGREGEIEASTQQLLEALDFGVMANFEARRDRWVFVFDVVYTDFGKDVTLGGRDEMLTPRPARADMSMTIVGGDVGYRLGQYVDVFAGVRGVSVPISLVTDAGTLGEADGGFIDPILGARVRHNLTEKLWVNVRGDIGGFGVGSDFSWYLGAAVGYRVTELLSLDFGYRAWGFDYSSDGDLRKLDAVLAGFALGATFHF